MSLPLSRNSVGEFSIKQEPGEKMLCSACHYTFRACCCESCLKCGTLFSRFYGSSIIRGRSHCRTCQSPVCVTCVVSGQEKVCTRCYLVQRENEITTEKALSAINEAKYGQTDQKELPVLNQLKTLSQKSIALLNASKKGEDHVIMTLLNTGCHVNIIDLHNNTPLFYSAQGGFIVCVALILEKGADINVKNKSGMTALHAVVSSSSTPRHKDCAEFLIQMGIDVLAESNDQKTAADLAESCNVGHEIVRILRAAEVECAMQIMQKKMGNLLASIPNYKERQFYRLVTTLMNQVKSGNKENKDVSPETNASGDTGSVCLKCKGKFNKGETPSTPVSNVVIRPQADVEPIVRAGSPHSFSYRSLISDNSGGRKGMSDFAKMETEKLEWEDRARKFMQSIAISNKEHDKQVEYLKLEIERLKEEFEANTRKGEASYSNKFAKFKQERDGALLEAQEMLSDSRCAFKELSALQKNFKMTWVPDELVKKCQHVKCNSIFSNTVRKHHCRCCGRVFCKQCTKNNMALDVLGYNKPVRVCNTCFTLAAGWLEKQ